MIVASGALEKYFYLLGLSLSDLTDEPTALAQKWQRFFDQTGVNRNAVRTAIESKTRFVIEKISAVFGETSGGDKRR